jgi:hypothetical protein
MPDTVMSRDEIKALVSIQDDMEMIAYQEMPTPSGRFRVGVATFASSPDQASKEEVRELIALLIGTARELEGLT